MKRFVLAVALACVLSSSALAGDIHTTGAPAPPPPGEVPSTGAPGEIPTTGSPSPGDMGNVLALMILDLLF